MEDIIAPIDKEVLKSELTEDKALKIYEQEQQRDLHCYMEECA